MILICRNIFSLKLNFLMNCFLLEIASFIINSSNNQLLKIKISSINLIVEEKSNDQRKKIVAISLGKKICRDIFSLKLNFLTNCFLLEVATFIVNFLYSQLVKIKISSTYLSLFRKNRRIKIKNLSGHLV